MYSLSAMLSGRYDARPWTSRLSATFSSRCLRQGKGGMMRCRKRYVHASARRDFYPMGQVGSQATSLGDTCTLDPKGKRLERQCKAMGPGLQEGEGSGRRWRGTEGCAYTVHTYTYFQQCIPLPRSLTSHRVSSMFSTDRNKGRELGIDNTALLL